MPPTRSSSSTAYPQSRIPVSTKTPVPILIPSLRVTAPTPGKTPNASVTQDSHPPIAAPRAKSVKSVRIQEPEPRLAMEMIAERGERQRLKQLEGHTDRSRVAPWAEPDQPSRAAPATLKKKGKENKKDVISTLSGFRVAIDPSPPLPELVSQPRPLSRNASVRAPLAVPQERARADSKATLLSFKSNRSATSAKTASSVATTSSTATTSTTASAQSATSQASAATNTSRSSTSQFSTIRDAPSSRSKHTDGLEKKKSRSRLGLDSLFHAWGPNKDAASKEANEEAIAPEVKEKSLWARTIGRKSIDKERARSPTPTVTGRQSGEGRRSMETQRARSPTPSVYSARLQPRSISPPLGRPAIPESIAMMLETAPRCATPVSGVLAPSSVQADHSALETDSDKDETIHGPRFMRSIRSIATFRQKQSSRDCGESTSSGSSWEAGAPSAANSPAKPALGGPSKTSIAPEAALPPTSIGTVNSIKDVGDGTIRGMASIFGLRSISRASNHSDTQRVRKARSSTGTFDSVSSRDVTSLPPHLLRSDYPTPPSSQLQAAVADVPSIKRNGSKMRRPGLQGLFDGIKKHKVERSREEKKALHESWVEIERPDFECSEDGKELIALAMPFALPPATPEELEHIARARSQSPPPTNADHNLPDLLDPTPRKDATLRVKSKEDDQKQSSLRGSLRRVFQPETQRTPRKGQRTMSDGDRFDFTKGPPIDFSALAAANSELSDLISSLDLTGATPDCTPAKSGRFFSSRPALPAFPPPSTAPAAVAKADGPNLVTPEVHANGQQDDIGASSLPTPVSAEGGFKKSHKALPSLSTLRGRQLKSISATARDEWMDLFPVAMGVSTSVDGDATHAIIEPSKTDSLLSVPESYKDWISSLRGSQASISLSASTLDAIAGDYLAFTAQGSDLSTSNSTTSIYESAQESLSKADDALPQVVDEELRDAIHEILPERARSPPPSMPLPPTPNGDMSFSLIIPGGLPSKIRELLPDINTTLATLDCPLSTTSDDLSPLSRKSSGSERSLDFTETYNQLAGPSTRKSFVNYVAHVSEEMFGNEQYLSSVLNLNESAAPQEDLNGAEAVMQPTGMSLLAHDEQEAHARTRRGHVPADSYASLPSMYNEQLPGDSAILNLSAPSALHNMSSIISDGSSKRVSRFDESIAFPQSQPNRDSYGSYDSYVSTAISAEMGEQRKAHEKSDTEYSIPSISSYGALLKPGVPNPIGYTASERARLDSAESNIRPLTAAAMAAMDEEQMKRRFNRQSNDSVASTWSFHASTRPPPPLQYRSNGHGDVISGPPPAYLNNNKRNSLMRSRVDSADSHSAVQAYQSYGGMGGIAASGNSRRDSQDSAFSELSEMSPMSYQRRGRPGITDEKMFDSAHGASMLESIVDASEADISSRASFDSEARSTSARESDMELSSDEEDSLFPVERKRESVSADSLFTKEDDRQTLSVPGLFQGQSRKPRPVSTISQDSARMPGPDDTMMTMLDGDLGWAPRSGMQSSPSVEAAKNRQARLDKDSQAWTEAQDTPANCAQDPPQSVRISELRMSKVFEALRSEDSMEKVVLRATGLSDGLAPTPRITKPAPPSARKKVGVASTPRVSVALGTVPDTPPYTSSEAGSTSSIDLPKLHASLSKFPASGMVEGIPGLAGVRARPQGQGHRRFSGFAISTITEETPSVPSATAGNRSRSSSLAEMEAINELNKRRRDSLEKRKSLLLELRQSQVLFPGAVEADEIEEDHSELPTTKEAILTFLAKSQNKFKPRSDLPARTRTRSRTNSRPSPYPLPEWQQSESQPVPERPAVTTISKELNCLPALPLALPISVSLPRQNALAESATQKLADLGHPMEDYAEPTRPAVLDEETKVAAPKAMVPRPRTKSGTGRQALSWSRRHNPVLPHKAAIETPPAGFVLKQAAKLNATDAKLSVLSDEVGKPKRPRASTAGARENEALGMLVSPGESLRISRPKPKGRPGSRAPAPVLLRN
ncbi:hypothetical protein CALVIDRAFT_565736 [Calocera viscosa TUFC12733]|uniref:Uncharacterized protein n=1 Tax=Calocera viscosa (strain TUFC12733) TaxID=1330018 RepID=A0A167K8E2_CALVF|nr:hypothetical protein CALVIDRAFT_565736 [Calocera viscosa TUFC12733]